MGEVSSDLRRLEDRVLEGLKDFQRETVERVFSLFEDGKKRVLVSDEVGLGKTLIARGTIAKLARAAHAAPGNVFKVVYICSNAAIAGQNLNKLRLNENFQTENVGASRLSMQHLNIFMQKYAANGQSTRTVQLIPLTPDTSFRMTSGTGITQERALMYAILRRIPALAEYLDALDVAMMDYAYGAWNSWAKAMYERQVTECDERSGGAYLSHMCAEVERKLSAIRAFEPTYLEQLIELCNAVAANGYQRVGNTAIISKLRVTFAQISIDFLEPDLVIMDEFQRFRFLLQSDADTETGLLAKRFLSSEQTRTLLLSATPYKLYQTAEEIHESHVDEHYREFFEVMQFLQSDPEHQNFRIVWADYSTQLKELSCGETAILEVKHKAEDLMYANICRTERISADGCTDLIDDSSVSTPLTISTADVRSYIEAQRVLDQTDASYKVPVDYVKSAPYLLSFMRDYKVKTQIEQYFKAHPDEIGKADGEYLWLKRNVMENFGRVEPANARLAHLEKLAFENGAENILWVPPSQPYYALGGAFKGAQNFTKTLVFSSWEMVPRMIAALLSYEDERRSVQALIANSPKREAKAAQYFSSDSSGSKRYPLPKLNFSVSLGEPKAMNLFCLLYPSAFLASCYVPLEELNQKLSLKQLEREVRKSIKNELRRIPQSRGSIGREDDRWYYLAPLLLDDEAYVTNWFDGMQKNMDTLAQNDEDGGRRGQKGFSAHLARLKDLYKKDGLKLGRQPADLLDVLTNMVLASPAICMYRTYMQAGGGVFSQNALPSLVAKTFLDRMNTTESTAAIEATYGSQSEDAHWKNVLSYCKDGNLQAVFDEYVHMLRESNGLEITGQSLSELHRLLTDSMKLRTTIYNVDTFTSFKSRLEGRKPWPVNIRSHFAVAFTKGDGKSDQDADRKRALRDAFNSPFRPFVLASTSIGQEGLDFHYYCRRIVHWNLPSNPIDLEQREGRINRFKCLAIRQNVAARYGGQTFEKDLWSELFEAARQHEFSQGSSELVPFWSIAQQAGIDTAVKIERIVPMYPFSRDAAAYERLIKILSLYRLTLGHARQAELLEHLLQNSKEKDDAWLQKLFVNLSPYFKKVQDVPR